MKNKLKKGEDSRRNAQYDSVVPLMDLMNEAGLNIKQVAEILGKKHPSSISRWFEGDEGKPYNLPTLEGFLELCRKDWPGKTPEHGRKYNWVKVIEGHDLTAYERKLLEEIQQLKKEIIQLGNAITNPNSELAQNLRNSLSNLSK